MIITGNPADVAAAYVQARSEIDTLLKKDGQGARGKYPTLAGILEKITPILISHGLVMMQETTSNEFGVGVSTSILHSSGSSIDFAPLTMQPADLKPQTVGSTISYCRRYALVSALGLVGGKEDDDGEKGTYGDKPATAKVPQAGTPAQNGYSHQDDVLWEPNEKPKKSDAITPAQLTRLTILVTDFYGAEAKDQEIKLSQAVSKGAVSQFKELTVKEAQVLISGVERKMKEVQAA
jgi:ERF superfamily